MWVQPVMFVVLEGCSLPVLDATRVALFSLNAGGFLCRPCIREQAKDLSARLEETGAERDTLAAQLRDLKSDQEVWHRQKAILEGALASATAVSSEVSVLQVCSLAMCVVLCFV